MKFPLFAGLTTALIANCAYGVYITNFDALPWGVVGVSDPGSDVNGIDGWTINDTNDQFSQVTLANANPADPYNQSLALNLGGSTDHAPLGSSVVLSHPQYATVGATKLIFDFMVQDSINSNPARNAFGVSISNGGGNVFAIYFTPKPGDVGILNPQSDLGLWDIDYKVGSNPTVPLNLTVQEISQYNFNLDLHPNSGNSALTDFDLTIISAKPNVMSDGAVGLNLNPDTWTDKLNVLWLESPSASFGSDSIVIDNLSVVPEPSSALLVCLAGLGFVTRRRRA